MKINPIFRKILIVIITGIFSATFLSACNINQEDKEQKAKRLFQNG